MAPEDVLAVWERYWGTLSDEHRRRFLRRDEVVLLGHVKIDLLHEALKEHRKLTDALTWAQAQGPLSARRRTAASRQVPTILEAGPGPSGFYGGLGRSAN